LTLLHTNNPTHTAGKKEDLIERLTNPNYRGKKPEKWQHSDAKRHLKKMLLDPSSPIHSMTVDEVQKSDPRFKKYPLFSKYYKDLKTAVEDEKKRVKMDDIEAAKHLQDCKRQKPRRGYPRWHDHPAKNLLEVDVARKLHKEMPPRKLRRTRPEYIEFPQDVFCKRVNNEVNKQRAAAFWAHKRNKHGMKRYLEDLKKRSE